MFSKKMFIMGFLFFSFSVLAFDLDSDDGFENIESVKSGSAAAAKRMFPGGRDEQDLVIQNQIPQPPRSLEGHTGGNDTGIPAGNADL